MKTILLFAALIFLPFAAQAAGPSFNCKKAKRPDEVAICHNVVLAEDDLETTRLFNLMKATNRSGAIAIAKVFLKARRACGSNPQCIGAAQTAAIMTFHQSMGKPADAATTSDNAGNSEATVAAKVPKQTAPIVVDTSNPWPDSFARRDYKLGITISQFLSMPFPDLNRDPGTYALCSNDPRLSNPMLTGYTSLQFLPADWLKAGIVECMHFWNDRETNMVFEAGLGLADTMVDTKFYFIPDNAGTLRLFWITTDGPAEQFVRLASIMQTAYGQPILRTETWQNQMGNSFNNQILTWSNSASQIEFRNFGDKITTFHLEHRLSVLFAKFGAAIEQSNKDAAKRL